MLRAFYVILVLFVGFVGPAARSADESKSEGRPAFDRLELTDGRVLFNVLVRSFDSKAEKVLLVANGKALVVTLGILPEHVVGVIRRAPAAGETVNTMPESKSPTQGPTHPTSAPVIVSPAPVAVVRKDPLTEAPAAALLREHRDAAGLRARRYFGHELLGTAESERIEQFEMELGTPTSVTGWAGRYRTEGKVFIRFLDWRTLQSRRVISAFEVVTEQKPGEAISVVDFSRKS